ncbi:hypothetical protein BpHYR1_026811, partial [Brachionus plicatilis]
MIGNKAHVLVRFRKIRCVNMLLLLLVVIEKSNGVKTQKMFRLVRIKKKHEQLTRP